MDLLEVEARQLRQQLAQSVADDSASARIEKAMSVETARMDTLRDSVEKLQAEVRIVRLCGKAPPGIVTLSWCVAFAAWLLVWWL